MECYLEEEFCAFELTFVRGTSVSCTELIAIEVNGNVYSLNSSIDILFGNAMPPVSEQMEAAIEAALDTYGLFGEASVTIGFTAALELEFQVLVTNSNASSLKLLFEDCALPEVFNKSEDCCEPGAAPTGDGGLAGSENPDLFYEHITYNGLDISRIDMGSNCMTGFMRNEYQYDANHRLTDVRNTFFMPEPVVGLFSSNYTYDLAGNLLTLKRFGLEDPTVMGTSPVLIDNLVYAYGQGSSVLNSVTDDLQNPAVQPFGFSPGFSGYGYDAAGNLITDGGKDLTIDYNLLNLPGSITHPTDGDIRYAYTFGGHKFLKTTELADEEEETRLYLGGAEFVDGQPESYYHGEGRVALTGDKPAFQYKLTDHLGNTMVLFEDHDEDGIITTESMSSNDPVEVLQRNFYYAFGLPMQGPWNHAPADPDMPYLYNGKELEGELGLGWYAYGFRYYDASVGRFVGVDPLAGEMPDWSSYSYTFCNPIVFVDPDGRLPVPVITGIIGAAGGLIYGIASGKSWKQTAALTAGGFVFGATLGLGGTGIAALGGVEAIGGAGAGYITIGSGVVGGFAGNAVEQGVRIALGEDDSFDGEEFVISGAFGMSEVVLGPAGNATGNATKGLIKEGLKSAIRKPSRADIRRTQKEIARQLRQQAGPGVLSKQQARQGAKGLIEAAQQQRATTLQGAITFTGNGVDVSVSAMQTTVTEETKTNILENGNEKKD